MIAHIVHLEDDTHLVAILRAAIENLAPHVRLAQFTTGADTLRYMENPPVPVDILVVDIRIPGTLDGLQTAHRVREAGYAGPIIVSSAYAVPPRTILANLRADYLAKPWHIESLLQRLGLSASAKPERAQAAHRPAIVGAGASPAAPARLARDDRLFEDGVFGMLRLLCATLDVPGAVAIVGETPTGASTHQVAYPDSLAKDRTLLGLAGQVMRLGKPFATEDVRTFLRNAETEVVAFAGLPFSLPDKEICGALCAVDDTPRAWSAVDRDALHTALGLFRVFSLLHHREAGLIERNYELNTYTDIIAHDLKTPLAALVNYAELVTLLAGQDLRPDVLMYLGRIRDSAHTMSEMITQLLWLARLEKPLERVLVVDMNHVLESAMRRLQHTIEERGVSIDIPADLPPALGHDVWVEEVVVNLLSNAVKYMGEQNAMPCIWVRGYPLEERVRYEVQDNGIGIAEEDLATLFQSFSRLHKVEVDGLGLGLSIVRRIITRLGGTVGVESAPGQGSLFWFSLSAPGFSPRPVESLTE